MGEKVGVCSCVCVCFLISSYGDIKCALCRVGKEIRMQKGNIYNTDKVIIQTYLYYFSDCISITE